MIPATAADIEAKHTPDDGWEAPPQSEWRGVGPALAVPTGMDQAGGGVMTREGECWCGVKRPYFDDEPHYGCDGSGEADCLCGGDQCVCHWHGTAFCDGCDECRGVGLTDDEDDHEVQP